MKGPHQLVRNCGVRTVGHEIALRGHQQWTAVVTNPEIALDLNRRSLRAPTATRPAAAAAGARFPLLGLLLFLVVVHSILFREIRSERFGECAEE
jgi:hypothetical protein